MKITSILENQSIPENITKSEFLFSWEHFNTGIYHNGLSSLKEILNSNKNDKIKIENSLKKVQSILENIKESNHFFTDALARFD